MKISKRVRALLIAILIANSFNLITISTLHAESISETRYELTPHFLSREVPTPEPLRPRVVYDSLAGTLEIADSASYKAPLRHLLAFGKIPGIGIEDIDLLYFDPTLIVIRHDVWVSVIDTQNDQPIISNLGPFLPEPQGYSKFNQVTTSADGRQVLTFTARVNLKNQQHTDDQRNLVIIPIGTATLREKNPLITILPLNPTRWPVFAADMTLTDERLSIQAKYDVHFYAPGQDQRSARLDHLQKTASTPLPTSQLGKPIRTDRLRAKATLHLVTAQMTEHSGARAYCSIKDDSFIQTEGEKNSHLPVAAITQQNLGTLLNAPPERDPESLLKTANSVHASANVFAQAIVNKKIDEAKGVAPKIQAAMKRFHGQSDAVKAYIKLVQAMRLKTLGKFQVVLVTGPTGSGKTSGIETLSQELNQGDSKPFYKTDLSDGEGVEFLRAELSGAKPGFLGSDSVGALASWMLEHPKRGSVLFDEFDKSPPEVATALLGFLGHGELKVTPQHVKIFAEQYKLVPMEEWPEPLRLATNNGTTTQREMVLKLTDEHLIFLGSNIGASLYTGNSGSSVVGKRLKATEDIKAANALLTEEYVKKELRSRGYSDEWLNRISSTILYKILLPEDHAKVVDDQIAEFQKTFRSNFLMNITLTDELKDFLKEASYSPLDGVRYTITHLETWLHKNVSQVVLDSLRAGDSVQLSLKRGDAVTQSQMELRRNETPEILQAFAIGKPPIQRPVALYERARARLRMALDEEVDGYDRVKDQIVSTIIGKLYEAIEEPNDNPVPIIIELDGAPGIGKTQIGKAIAKALFDDPEMLVRIDMASIHSLEDFDQVFLSPIIASVRRRPDRGVFLLDEFPRLGEGVQGLASVLQDELLPILDEGRLRSPKSETRKVGKNSVSSGEFTSLPHFSVFITTGNLSMRALGQPVDRMNNQEFSAHFAHLMRHPEAFNKIRAQTYKEALLSRLPTTILMPPANDQQITVIQKKFFTPAVRLLAKKGAKVEIGSSLQKYIYDWYLPARGGRWFRELMEKHIGPPLNAKLAESTGSLEGATVRLEFDEKAWRVVAHVERQQGNSVNTEIWNLGQVELTKSVFHPVSIENAAWMTSVHEAGHAILLRILFNDPEIIQEMQTFGGGEGGWMVTNTASRAYVKYNPTLKGVYSIAVGLGGHVAEVMILGQSAEGAGNDFEKARSLSQTMIDDGSTLGFAPLPGITDPKSGLALDSEALKMERESRQRAILQLAGELAHWVIKNNPEAHMALAKALHHKQSEKGNAQRALGVKEIMDILATVEKTAPLKFPTEKDLLALIDTLDDSTAENCRSLLINRSNKPHPVRFRDRFLKLWAGIGKK